MVRSPPEELDPLSPRGRCYEHHPPLSFVGDDAEVSLVSEENRRFEICIVGTTFRMLGLTSYLVSVLS